MGTLTSVTEVYVTERQGENRRKNGMVRTDVSVKERQGDNTNKCNRVYVTERQGDNTNKCNRSV